MRWLKCVTGVVILSSIVGCGVPQEARNLAKRNRLLQERVVKLIEGKNVTQSQLEENARVNADNWKQFDILLNGE